MKAHKKTRMQSSLAEVRFQDLPRKSENPPIIDRPSEKKCIIVFSIFLYNNVI
jgi:hypothetical protein